LTPGRHRDDDWNGDGMTCTSTSRVITRRAEVAAMAGERLD